MTTITELFPTLTPTSDVEAYAQAFAAHPNIAFALNYPSLDKSDPRVAAALHRAAQINPVGVYEAIQLRGRFLVDESGTLTAVLHGLCSTPESAERIAPLMAEALHLSPAQFSAFIATMHDHAVAGEKGVEHALPAMRVNAEGAVITSPKPDIQVVPY